MDVHVKWSSEYLMKEQDVDYGTVEDTSENTQANSLYATTFCLEWRKWKLNTISQNELWFRLCVIMKFASNKRPDNRITPAKLFIASYTYPNNKFTSAD